MIATPTRNAKLPLRLGRFAVLRDALDYAAHGDTGINFHDVRGRLQESMSYAQLRDRALAVAWWLHRSGHVTGTRIALIAETSADFLAAFYGSQYAGLVPCPLPGRAPVGSVDAYVASLCRWLARADASMLLAPERLLGCATLAAASSGIAVSCYENLPRIPEEDRRDAPAPAHDVAYVQFSSGSTAEPKGVVVTQRALMANATAIAQHGLRMHADDRAFSWLPLYHDMGLVGFSVVALCGQRSVDYLAPASFAARPLQWLRLMSTQRSTIVYAPPFAWQIAAQRYGGEPDIDLSALRIAGIGGDMLEPSVLDTCMQKLAPAGLRTCAWQPSYGMAEATLAISMTDVERPPTVDDVVLAYAKDGTPLAARSARWRATRRLVGAGRTLPGIQLEARSDKGARLPDRHIGQLWVRGNSIMRHYLGETRDRCDERGFFDTGDLGYLDDGEVFITGRSKDMIPIRGRNVWLRDLEWTAERVRPLMPGDTAALAFDASADTSLVLLVQRRIADEQEGSALAIRITEAIVQALGVSVRVQFVPPRSLPYTTSGKLARQELVRLYLSGALQLAAAPGVPARNLEPTT